MGNVYLQLAERDLIGIRQHLLGEQSDEEEVAFVFARYEQKQDERTFRLLEWAGVPPDGFESRSRYHLSLSDDTRGGAIRRAHDLQCCLVEWHSHVGYGVAEFSPSDLWGLREFVPHVRWRLAGRPYGAVVVSGETFDGLAWVNGATSQRLWIRVEPQGKLLSPTALSPLDFDATYD